MAELPSPHSIAIGTLIALYSDVNSPLFAYNDDDDDHQQQHHRHPLVAAQWPLVLSRLIQQLVMRQEEDGLFALVLHPGGGSKEDDNPFAASGGDWEDPNDVIELFGRHHTAIAPTEQDFLHDFWDTFDLSRRQSINYKSSEGDSTQTSLLSSSPEVASRQTKKTSSFRMQTLSSLLDQLDDAFYHLPNNNNRHHFRQATTATTRSPPSIALLSRLQTATSSIDDLINLLDEWHALLDGSHVGYPIHKASTSSSSSANNNTTVVAVDGDSTFGIHLRKLCLGMEEIPFEALSRLWMAVKGEVDDETSCWFMSSTDNNNKNKNNQLLIATTTTAANTTITTITNNTTNWLPSSPQIERLLRRTCLNPNLETYLLRQERNTTTKLIITSIMEELQQTHPECPSISFFLFLSSLAKGERSQALESLHRYFDYAMIHERKERAERAVMLQLSGGASSSSSNNNNTGGGGGNYNHSDAAAIRTSGMGGITTMASGMGGITGGMTGGVMNGMIANNNNGPGGGGGGRGSTQLDAKIYKESNVMEYAAVLLAQMHYRFGFSRLSLQATEEAIRVAQQSGDDECVSFANGWLAMTSSSIGGGGGGGGKRSVYATVGGLPSNDAVALGSRGYRPLVPSVSNCIGRSTLEEEAMLQHSQTRATQRGLASLSIGTSLELARRTLYRRDADGQLCSNESEGVVQSSSLAWDRIQRLGMASSPSFVDNRPGAGLLPNRAAALGQIHTDVGNMIASDVIGILGRQAMAESGLWDSTGHSSLASLSSCRAMTHDAWRRVLSTFSHGPGSGGRNIMGGSLYVETLGRIATMSEKTAPTPEWNVSASAFFHEWSARSYDISVARNLQSLIANHVIFPFNSLPPVETSLMLLTKSTHLFLQQEDYERAKSTARKACWLSSRHALFFHQGWHLLQLALIDLEASTSSPSNFESSLSPLLECLHLSDQYVMDPLRATALSTLSRVFLGMGRICKARALLNAAIPLLMQHGHVWFQAEACLTLAKCYLAEVSSKEMGAPATQLRQNALVQLEKAASLFEKIDDVHRLKQVYYLQARIYQYLLSNQKKRDEAAKKFFRFNMMKQYNLTGRKQWNTMHGILVTDINAMLKSW